jgi:hypothetical protein
VNVDIVALIVGFALLHFTHIISSGALYLAVAFAYIAVSPARCRENEYSA